MTYFYLFLLNFDERRKKFTFYPNNSLKRTYFESRIDKCDFSYLAATKNTPMHLKKSYSSVSSQNYTIYVTSHIIERAKGRHKLNSFSWWEEITIPLLNPWKCVPILFSINLIFFPQHVCFWKSIRIRTFAQCNANCITVSPCIFSLFRCTRWIQHS